MQQYTQRVVTGLAAVGAGLALVQPAQAQALSSNTPGAIVLERILVKVNGGLVTQTDLEAAQLRALRGRAAQPRTDAELRQAVQEITPELIVNVVDELLMVQRGHELGYALDEEQFQEILDGIKEENNFDDEQLMVALQRDEGMTLPDLRDVMERQMLIQQVQQIEILARVSMTDPEAREYYDSHLEEFTQPATVTLQEILIGVPAESGALTVARDDLAKTAAEVARGRVLAGEDFGQVASEVSDAASKANGGLIGPIELGDLAESVRERIEALDVGAVGEIQRTTAGYQILKLGSATEPTPTPFDDVRGGIMDSVFNERRLRALDEYVDTLRAEAIIEWRDEGLKSVYDEALANRDTAVGGV